MGNDKENPSGQNEWYTNKQIYDMVQDLYLKLDRFSAQVGEMNKEMKKYNNLRKELNRVLERLNVLETEKDTKEDAKENFINWGGFGISFLSLLIAAISVILLALKTFG